MTKHLALVISSLSAGGAERVLSELANAWVEEGYKISLITLAPQGAKLFYPLSKKINLLQLNQLTSENANVFKRLKNIYKRVMALRKTFKQLQPDLVISFIDIMNITTLLAGKGLKIPIVVAERTHPKYHPLPVLYRRIRKWVYPWASKIIVQTQSAADYFPSNLHPKITIIPNFAKPMDKIKSSTNIKKPVQKIISMGRLNAFKGFEDLIRSFSQLVSSYPNLNLTIYGEGEERAALETLIASMNLQEKVDLPGAVKNIPQVLFEADLFVFPSHYEGFPNALCEAMSAGLPVVASNCSGNIEVVKDTVNGRLFAVGNVSALTTLMTEIIEDSAQRIRLGQEAAKITIDFSKEKVLKIWERVISILTF